MTDEDPALERARQRAKELTDFYRHVLTYVVVNAMLVVIDLLDGGTGDGFLGLDWAYWPIIGWGIGLIIHAANTFIVTGSWEERTARRLYEKEKDRDIGTR